ncbi:MAG: hypothetical protein JWO78_206 [Micavibrio sp.]|nr:hypothetical protein [Micavibrio sp.]
MGAYDGATAQALKAITAKGRTISLIYSSVGSYDPENNQMVEGAEVLMTTKGLLTQFRTNQIDGEIIQASDMRILIAAKGLSLKPDNTMKVLDGDEVYQIINVTPLQPGDTAILYTVQARK